MPSGPGATVKFQSIAVCFYRRQLYAIITAIVIIFGFFSNTRKSVRLSPSRVRFWIFFFSFIFVFTPRWRSQLIVIPDNSYSTYFPSITSMSSFFGPLLLQFYLYSYFAPSFWNYVLVMSSFNISKPSQSVRYNLPAINFEFRFTFNIPPNPITSHVHISILVSATFVSISSFLFNV